MEEKQKHKGRVFLLVGVIIAVFVVFALRLMKYQIVDAEKYREMAQGNYTSTQSIDAARGEMLDRYGRPLAVNQVSYDVMINEAYLPNKMRNTVIERIILLMESEEQSWIDTLPISTTEPFAFLTETESQKRQLEQIKTNNKINLDADVQTTLDNLFKKYKLIHYTCKECGYRYEGELSEEKEDYVCPECGASKEQFEAYDRLMARKIAGVRYQMEVYGSSTSTPYTFSKDIPIDVVVTIKEYSQQMPGIEIKETTSRRYVDGSLAPHAIGVVGSITQEEYTANNRQFWKESKSSTPTGPRSRLTRRIRSKSTDTATSSAKAVWNMPWRTSCAESAEKNASPPTPAEMFSPLKSSSRQSPATPSSPPWTRICSGQRWKGARSF